MKILHVTPAYYPATYFGGPIFSTYALCNALAEIPGVELRVLTSDTAGPHLSDRVEVPSFPMRLEGRYDVYYTRRTHGVDIAPGMLARLPGMVRWADAVLLTATYSFPTIPTLLACRLMDKPVVWSPRGALQAAHEWSEARRPRAKRSWEWICRWLKPRRSVLHVTAAVEAEVSRARLPEFATAIIPNGVEAPSALPGREWCPNGMMRLMFISRIDPIKGLDTLIRVMPSIPDATLDIYGTGELSYVAEIERLVIELDLSQRVQFHGHVEGDAKRDAFLNADLFVLPTHSENFGMVVAEALAHAVPAVVSHGAPWPDLEAQGCGLWVPNTSTDIALAIERLRGADLCAMGALGRVWMQRDFSWSKRADDMWRLMQEMVSEARVPRNGAGLGNGAALASDVMCNQRSNP